MNRQLITLAAGFSAAALLLTACSSEPEATAPVAEPTKTEVYDATPIPKAPVVCDELTPVSLQLPYLAQAQFGGYYAAKDLGFYEEQCLDVTLLEGGLDIVPQTELAQGRADFAISWVSNALASREQGAGIVDVAQVFQSSGTVQVSLADSNITKVSDLAGKKVGSIGFGNEYELFAGMTKAGLDPASDVELVQQKFDMQALLDREIDAAQAIMTYNEYAMVLETVNPDTGELYQPSDFNVINWNEEGTAMYQDAVFASEERLRDATYRDTTQRFVTASLQGWIHCRDNAQECADIVTANGSKLGASHQLFMMNEVNKLVWPSPLGVGVIDPKLWKQTVKVSRNTKNLWGATIITAKPAAKAFNNQYAEAANAALKADGYNTTGGGYVPLDVALNEGGN